MPILKQPGRVKTEQMRKEFEDEILSFVDKRDREIVRTALEVIKNCAVAEAEIARLNGNSFAQSDQVCEECGKRLVCPACEGRKGGLKTARKYTKEQREEWGKTGGRPRGVMTDEITSSDYDR